MATTPVINRHAIALTAVTLNGHPAKVMGLRDEYATVRALRGECAPAQFAWELADKVCQSNGKFTVSEA